MRITILDFQEYKEYEFKTILEAKKYIASQYSSSDIDSHWSYFTRYINDWSMKNSEKYNEWLEVNCHNSPFMVVPTAALYNSKDLFDMIVYWHESIAFGTFGDESVDFEFTSEEKQKEYNNFVTDKWLAANVEKYEDLESWDWHYECNHERNDDELTEAGEKEEIDCEEYQLDDYIYNLGSGYYGAKSIDNYTIKNYINSTNEYEEALV